MATVAELRGSILERRNHVCTGRQCVRGGEVAHMTGAGGSRGGEVEPERESGAGPSGPRKGYGFSFSGQQEATEGLFFFPLSLFILRET